MIRRAIPAALFLLVTTTAWAQFGVGIGTTVAVQALSVEVGVDYYGADYRSFFQRSPDANECRAACAVDARCLAYTFLRPPMGGPTGKCHLKSSVPQRRTDACCISGTKPGQAPANGHTLPHDEFRPNTAGQAAVPQASPPQAPAPQAPAAQAQTTQEPDLGSRLLQAAPGLLGRLLTPQGQGGSAQQPYDEFRETQPPPIQPPPTQISPQPIPPTAPPLAAPVPQPIQPILPPAPPSTPPALALPPPVAPQTQPPSPPAQPTIPPALALPPPPALPAPPPVANVMPPVPPAAIPAQPLSPPTLPLPPPVAGAVPTPALPPTAQPLPPVPLAEPLPPITAEVAPKAELEVALSGFESTNTGGGSLGQSAEITVRNTGGRDATGAAVNLALLADESNRQGFFAYQLVPDEELFSADTIAPSAERSFKAGRITVPDGFEPGAYWLCAIADFSDTVDEADEGNNVACQPIEIGGVSPDTPPEPPRAPGPGAGPVNATGQRSGPLANLGVPQTQVPAVRVPELAGVIEREILLFRYPLEGAAGTAELFLPGAESSREVAYQDVDGLAIMEGDIVLGETANLAERLQAPPPPTRIELPPDCDGESCRRVDPLIASNRPRHLWPGGVIPYTISSRFNAGERGTIMDGIAMVNTAGTPLRLVPRAGHADYVHFEKARACNSLVGRQGGRQQINLDAADPAVGGIKCWPPQVAHEILHAAGIWHEQSRSDRDNFVQIVWANIQNGMASQFAQQIGDSMDIGPYDIGSIMHYGPTAFGKLDAAGNPQTTIRRTDGTPYARNNALSAGDIAGINQLYDVPGSVLPPISETRILTATVDRLAALTEDACNERMDFLAEMEIGPGWDWGRNGGGGLSTTAVVEGNDIEPGWQHEGSVPPNETRAKVYLRVMDNDDAFCGGGDDEVDVSPEPGRGHLELDVNLITGSIHLGAPTQWNQIGVLGDQMVLAGANGIENGAIQFTIGVR